MEQGDAAGPTAVLAVNGGLGEVFVDAGQDASDPYRDAAPEAGELRIPYRSFTQASWAQPTDPTFVRLGGPTFDAVPKADFDDVALWDRLLTFEELAVTYKATAPIGDVCEIR